MQRFELPAINFHVIKPCDSECTFCFATFPDVNGRLSTDDAKAVIDRFWELGAQKINFAGGEPTLHPGLSDLIRHAKGRGMTTSIVTNGFHLPRVLNDAGDCLDWVGLSVDSADEATQHALGRGKGDHVAKARNHAQMCRERGIRLKVNTVVTRLNLHEDMTGFLEEVAPERWKVFQVLPVEGQNEGAVDALLITKHEFQTYLQRHESLAARGITVVGEDNDAMTDSYIMIDPMGRAFGNTNNIHITGRPILEVGVYEALSQVGFDLRKLEARGGRYDW